MPEPKGTGELPELSGIHTVNAWVEQWQRAARIIDRRARGAPRDLSDFVDNIRGSSGNTETMNNVTINNILRGLSYD